MLKLSSESSHRSFIVVTEIGIIHTLKKQNPQKQFFPIADSAICGNMKKINLEKVLWSLEDMQYAITVAEDVRKRARAALDRMLEVLPAK